MGLFLQFSNKMASFEDNIHFDEIDNNELEMIRAGLVPKNTKKSEKNMNDV